MGTANCTLICFYDVVLLCTFEVKLITLLMLCWIEEVVLLKHFPVPAKTYFVFFEHRALFSRNNYNYTKFTNTTTHLRIYTLQSGYCDTRGSECG